MKMTKPVMTPIKRRRVGTTLFVSLILGGAVAVAGTAGGQQPRGDEPPLPENVVVDVDMIESNVIRIGIPDLLGTGGTPAEAAGILRRDFHLMPGYRVIGPAQINFNTESEGMGMDRGRWGGLQANGVIKGRVEGSGNSLTLEMKYFHLASGSAPVLTETYRGAPTQLRRWMHDFGNKILAQITSIPGPFGTHLAWAERIGPGRKDVKCADMDGHAPRRVTDGQGIAMLPSFGPDDNIWFTRLTPTGMFVSHTGVRGRPVLEGNGLNMAPAICNGKVFFVSSRDGNSEIYSSSLDGSGLRRLTNNRAIDVSPTCHPNGKVAFVSARHGNPQIWIMNADGSHQRRLTFKGTHNQTPTFCPNPRRNVLAFTGRDHTLDIFTLDVGTGEYNRITQGQGMNKDPAWSPDCRIVAFTSNRRGAPGVYLASPLGFNQNKIVDGAAETVAWQYEHWAGHASN